MSGNLAEVENPFPQEATAMLGTLVLALKRRSPMMASTGDAHTVS